MDVDAARAQRVRDARPACSARWHWRSPGGRAIRAASQASGKLTALRHVAVLEVVAQLVDHHHRAVLLGLARSRRPDAAARPRPAWPSSADEGKSVT